MIFNGVNLLSHTVEFEGLIVLVIGAGAGLLIIVWMLHI